VFRTHPWDWNFKICPYSRDMRYFVGVLKPGIFFFEFCSQQSVLMCTIYIFYIQNFISFVMFEPGNGFPRLRPLAQPQAVAEPERASSQFGRGLPVPTSLGRFDLPHRENIRGKTYFRYYYYLALSIIYIDIAILRLGLAEIKVIKRWPAQPEWPKQDRKILRRCMSRSPYKPQTSSVMDEVAVRWRTSMAHKLSK
jgi:hypothetical protein